MIDKIFYSTINKNAIKSIINEKILKNNNTNINNNFDNIILETMKYVESQVNSVPPKGVKTEEYLFLMNKKVYDIVTPIITKKIEAIPSNNRSVKPSDLIVKKKEQTLSNSINDTIFDPLLMKNYENPPLMDYPKPGGNPKNNEGDLINNKIKSMEDERSTLTPKLKPIDFTIKSEKKNNNTVQMYNDLLTNYNTQIDDMNKFESSQKTINKTIEKIENYQFDNVSDSTFTPIDLLKNKDDSQAFFQINNNNMNNVVKDTIKSVAYNRNDIETFINNDITDSINNYTSSNSDNLKNYTSSNSDNLKNYTSINSDDLNNNYNNDINSYSRTQVYNQEFSSTNPKNSQILFKEPVFNLVEKIFYIIFDSSDRDLYEYPNPTSFQVKFSPTGNNLRYESYYDEYSTLILMEKTVVYGDSSNLSVQETFDNINNISIKSVNAPINVIYIGSNDQQLTTTTGVPTNIYKEPYLYLVIPELRGPYRGGNLLAYNAFAKLLVDYSTNTDQSGTIVPSSFTTLKTADSYEYFLYDPVSAGKVDKMTLNIVNKNGKQYNFGIDKLYVQSLSEGTYRYNGYCGEKYLTTKITIQNINDEYIKYCSLYYKIGNCNLLNSHPVKEGDLLYFYDITPNNDQITFLEAYVLISKLTYDKSNNKLKIYASYTNSDGKNIPVNFKNIIPGADINNELIFKNYYIVLFDKKINIHYYLKIDSFSGKSIIVDYSDSMPVLRDYKNIKIGIAKANLSGSNNDDNGSFFNKTGYNVLGIGKTLETMWEIELDYPYDNLPQYLKDTSMYKPGEIFFIQEKMQVSYTFTVTIKTKDYQQLQSGLNESGNN